MNANFNNSQSNKLNPYLVKEIMEATPQQLLIKVYDFAILNCQKQNLVKTNNAIQELINSLRYDNDDISKISVGLLKLYQFCQDQMRKQNFTAVYKILTELRETWINAFKLMKVAA